MHYSAMIPDNQPCTRHFPCNKCAMVIVIRHRFVLFEEMFGRIPEPDEPLFFDPRFDYPVQAADPDIERQVISAAMVAEIPAEPILKFLGLRPLRELTDEPQEAPDETLGPAGTVQAAKSPARPQPQARGRV